MLPATFHPSVRRWFEGVLGEPSPPQREGWPRIQAGRNTLIAAPTGSGKTLAAFLWAIDGLFRRGDALEDVIHVVYVSPLKALSNDVAKNLDRPLRDIRALDPTLPEVRVMVRTGDTPQKDRAAMSRRPPHMLVTTPESLYILLTSDGGRRMLRGTRTVIVDEIHALARDKRGSHLSLSLERLEKLAGPQQRIGLSATQRPLDEIGRFLVGVDRAVDVVDAGHLRRFDLAVEVPPSPLSAVCSHEVWDEVYERVAALIIEHRTTLVFVNTRKLAERLSARLAERLGEDAVRCHHGSLSRELRLDAEARLKDGRLKALVATASLELGIDIGDVDLAIQIGAARSIATFLQRMGRAGHGPGRIPKGRLFPVTRDELVEAAALMRAVRSGELDRIRVPQKPLDILAQHLVAACVAEDWDETELFATVCRAWPYRGLTQDEFDRTVKLHLGGRRALLHEDGVNRRLRATRRARLRAVMNGGAIPDVGDYRVILEPEGVFVGTINEDFAIESSQGDVFQLGTTSWRVLRVESGVMRVADAKGAPPTLPFWVGEAPGRTEELSAEIGRIREENDDVPALRAKSGLEEGAAQQIVDYLRESERVLGVLPTQRRLVAERFFDEAGGTQLVLHAPFGSRINRALGLALRKRICRGFGFELQAAANEEAIVFSMAGPSGVACEEIFDWLHPGTLREVLVQATLPTPFFEARWRWNVTRALLVERFRGGKPVPILLQKMQATDVLMEAFPQVVACPETLTTPNIEVPEDHPLVAQTIEDCLTEAMDLDGCRRVLEGLRDGSIERVFVDVPDPSPLSRGILSAAPYAFLDDAPLEERRTRAVAARRTLDDRTKDEVGSLDPKAVERVREEAWPDPRDAEEVHEALTWMGFVADGEANAWRAWLEELARASRVVRDGDRWFAAEASRDPKAVLRGRMEVLGPVFDDGPLYRELEADGVLLRVRQDGRDAWCDRRLLMRIQRYTLESLRREIEPVSVAQFWRFMARWQHAHIDHRVEGPHGVSIVLAQLAGFEAPARAWETRILPLRVKGYRREWLDQVALCGEYTWGRLFGDGRTPIKTTPIAFVRREHLAEWMALSPAPESTPSPEAARLHAELAVRGAAFPSELAAAHGHLEPAVAELIGLGLLTADSFAAIRGLLLPPSRRGPLQTIGRLSVFRHAVDREPSPLFVARQLLARTGVVFRRTVQRERIPTPWRDLVRVLRRLELQGEVRGGRFVAGVDGEQFALPAAVDVLRASRRQDAGDPIDVCAADPLNFKGILTPDARVAPTSREAVRVGGAGTSDSSSRSSVDATRS